MKGSKKHTHRKAEEILELKLTKSRETFSFKPSPNRGLDSNWIIELTSLEVYNLIFNLTGEISRFELYTVSSADEFSLVELKDEITEVLELSHI